MQWIPKEPDEHHDFAFSITHDRGIHISEANDSGRRGYTCLGCKRDMQAILRKIPNAKSYFRHDPKNVQKGDRCTFKDEEYRRKIAISALELEKQIRVPPLYKLPPKGSEGLAIPMLPAESIQAAWVRKDMFLYEDLSGNLQYSSEFTPEQDLLVYHVDVVFFNEDGEPILFIQLVKKYGVTPEQQAALKRMRINTIQITIPKDSPESIYNSLMTGKRARWIYHDDEQQISYFSIPTDTVGGIPAAYCDQGKLLEESFDCRKVQINNLIRTINRCLESEPYISTERGNRAFIGNANLDIIRAREQWNRYQEQHRATIERELSGEFEAIRARRAELKRDYSSLETRYRGKKRELEEKARLLDIESREQEKAIGGTGQSFEEARGELNRKYERETRSMEQRILESMERVEDDRRRISRGLMAERENFSDLQQTLQSAPARNEFDALNKGKYFDNLEANERAEIERIETEATELPKRFAGEEEKLREEFKRLRERSAEIIKNRDVRAGTDLSRRLKDIFSARGHIVDIEVIRAHQARYREVEKFIGSDAGKTWLSTYKS